MDENRKIRIAYKNLNTVAAYQDAHKKATLMKIEYSSRLTPVSIATFETFDGKTFTFTSPKADSLKVAKTYSVKIAGDKVVEVK
jgi:hypothetical protein